MYTKNVIRNLYIQQVSRSVLGNSSSYILAKKEKLCHWLNLVSEQSYMCRLLGFKTRYARRISYSCAVEEYYVYKS